MTDDLEKAFIALRREYAASLPAKLAELQAALDEAERTRTPAALAHATSLAHRLAGTAGSYGLAQVSEAAALLEERLGSAASKGFAGAREALQVLQAQEGCRPVSLS